ncbi:Bud-site selection protein [Rhexocercosporidium sp. MPI-PUGE-AT-0058]|nr:Bud-site selection protein [Rhexocercosporidium sp. MPI-PUGE-AT-0058]
MPKRKRSTFEGAGDRVQHMRREDAQEKLTQSKKLLHRALKTAKGFQRQKLGNRLKIAIAENKSEDIVRINREIEALKAINLDQATDAHLHKTLLKIKRLAESDVLPEEVRKVVPRPELSEEMIAASNNVLSGMTNTKAVKDAMPQIITGMYIAMGIPPPAVPSKTKGGKKDETRGILKQSSIGVSRRQDTEDGGRDSEFTGEPKTIKEPSKTIAWDGFESPGDDEDSGDEDMGSEAELARYDTLLGGSSDEESFDEEEYAIERKPSQSGPRLSLTLSPSPSSESTAQIIKSQSPEPKQRREKVSKPRVPITAPKGSTFLPSLNAGYWSGSESSASDFNDAPPPVKKNRPGQMARRAIAEKKHGSGANHIKKGLPPVAEMGKKKGDGWDAKRGATDGESGRGGGFGARGRGGNNRGGRQRDFSQVTGENAIAVEPRIRVKKRDDIGVLHPSWQAAKKAKEEKKTATFQGKKVTFD